VGYQRARTIPVRCKIQYLYRYCSRSLTASYFRHQRGLFLCFDSSDMGSFTAMKTTWLGELLKHEVFLFTVVVLALKTDKNDPRVLIEAGKWCNENKMPLFQVCSLQMKNVVEPMTHLLNILDFLQQRKANSPTVIPNQAYRGNCC
jgi:GTPase SAR1 family protein